MDEPAHGALALNASGSFTYEPNDHFNGSDSFTYEACDNAAACDIAIVSITITPVNDPPTAVDDSYSTDQGQRLTANIPGVLQNDSDVDGDPLIALLVDDVTTGTLTLNSDGSFVYTPTAGFSGSDAFIYKANDVNLDSDIATVTITVSPPSCVAFDLRLSCRQDQVQWTPRSTCPIWPAGDPFIPPLGFNPARYWLSEVTMEAP